METIIFKRTEYRWKCSIDKSVCVWRRMDGYIYEVRGKQRSFPMPLKKVRAYLKKYDVNVKTQ